MEKILDKIEYLQNNYNKIIKKFVDIGSCSDFDKLKKECGQKISILNKLIDHYADYKKTTGIIGTLENKLKYNDSPDIKQIIMKESNRKTVIAQKIKEVLTPKNLIDYRDVVVRISNHSKMKRVDWAEKLSSAYIKYFLKIGCEYKRVNLPNHDFEVSGKKIFKIIDYERGLHKIKADKSYIVSVEVNPKKIKETYRLSESDLRIDVFHSKGHGGQSANTSNSAVRIIHLPTGITAESQDQRSQYQNKKNALKVLKNRVKKHFNDLQYDKIDFKKNVDIIRFYDFNNNLISDHRLKKSYDKLDSFFGGDISFITEELQDQEFLKELDIFFNYLELGT